MDNETTQILKETIRKWTVLLVAIETGRISHATILRKVVEYNIYFHHPDILRMMRLDQTRTPAFRDLLVKTMRETIDTCQAVLAWLERKG